MKTACALIFLASVIGVSLATICKQDTDCGSNECCYIKPQFMVVSKRQLAFPVPTVSDTGVCESYKSPGALCGPLEVLNGHCGCTTGNTCQWVPDPVVRRKLLPHDGPGAYRCAPQSVCESYHVTGGDCYPLETANGHCGCETGTHCQWVSQTTQATTGKRSMVYHPGPGSYKCAP